MMGNKMSRWQRHTVCLNVDATSKGAVAVMYYGSGYPLIGIDEPVILISVTQNNFTDILFDMFAPTDGDWFTAYCRYAASLYEDD